MRSLGGGASPLAFPDEFITAIQNLPSGGGVVDLGTYSGPSSETSSFNIEIPSSLIPEGKSLFSAKAIIVCCLYDIHPNYTNRFLIGGWIDTTSLFGASASGSEVASFAQRKGMTDPVGIAYNTNTKTSNFLLVRPNGNTIMLNLALTGGASMKILSDSLKVLALF